MLEPNEGLKNILIEKKGVTGNTAATVDCIIELISDCIAECSDYAGNAKFSRNTYKSYRRIVCFHINYTYLYKIREKLQDAFSSLLGETISPLSCKRSSSSSRIASVFLKIPIAPFMSAFSSFPVELRNSPLLILLPR